MVQISIGQPTVCEGNVDNYTANNYSTYNTLIWEVDPPNSFEHKDDLEHYIQVTWKEIGKYEVRVKEYENTNEDPVSEDFMEVEVYRPPNPMIAGPANPPEGTVQRYGTPDRERYEGTGTNFFWTVNGGTILNDWGNIIEVDWGTSSTGNSIEVKETNPGCSGKTVTKTINLEPLATTFSGKRQQLAEARKTRETTKLDYYHARDKAVAKKLEKENLDRKFKKNSDAPEYLSTKDALRILRDEEAYHRLNYRFHNQLTEQLYVLFALHGTGNHTDLVENLDDNYPILFFPVNLETKFKQDVNGNNNYHLYLRIYPDDVAIDNHEDFITKREKEAGDNYWQKVNERGASESDKISAWRVIAGKFGSERAAWIIRETNPETGNDPDLKVTSWSQPPRAKVLPDRFVVTIYRDGGNGYQKLGEKETNVVNDQLMTGFDPMDENAINTDTDNEDLILGEGVDWLEDFDQAVNEGMALKINMNNGFDQSLSNNDVENSKFRLVVSGVKLSADKDEGKELLENLIDSHHYSDDGMSLLKIDSSTSNSNEKSSDFVSLNDDPETSYQIEQGDPLFTPVTTFKDKKDGQILADALGIDYEKLQHIENAGNTDIQRAFKMNNAVWSATQGQRARETGGGQTAGNDPMSPEEIDKAREFFTKNAAGRGILPSIRIDDQPYGILPATVFDQWEWESDDPEYQFQTDLKNSLLTIDAELEKLVGNIIHYNSSGDTQENFLRVLGQQPVSPNFKHTFALGPDQIWNALSYQNQITKANEWYNQLIDTANNTFDELGFDNNNLPRILQFSFMPESGDLVTPIVQVPALSNIYPVVPIKGSQDNFLGWLGKSPLSEIRNYDLSSIGADSDAELPNSLMFRISRESMILEYWTAAMKLRQNYGEEELTPEDWRHPEFLGVSDEIPEGTTGEGGEAPLITQDGNVLTEDGRNVYTSDGSNVMAFFPSDGDGDVLTEDGRFIYTTDGREVVAKTSGYIMTYNDVGINTDGSGNVVTLDGYGVETEDHVSLVVGTGIQMEDIITNGYSYAYTLDMVIPSLSEYPLGEFIDYVIVNNMVDDYPEIAYVVEVKYDFLFLASQPSAVVELLFREHMDLNMHRNDAWQLGMVNRRLQKIRNTGGSGDRVKGIYLGAFGWVEDLQVKGDREYIDESQVDGIPEDMEAFYGGGHIHAPSPSHATTAAVLKSVYEGKKQQESDTDFEVPHINLSSERVRKALRYIQGINKGQELGALLGYEFERNLKENHPNLDLAQYIYVFRENYPLSQQTTPENAPSEDIKARDVVDGWQLYNQLRGEASEGNSYPYGLDGSDGLPSDVSSDVGQAIEDELDGLADRVDAINDLLLAESTHQLFQNNQEVAGSIIEAMSLAKKVPGDFDVLKTPRTGKNLTQRFALHLDTQNDTESGWPANIITERAKAEMNLNGWLAEKIGDPAQILCEVTFRADTDNDDTFEIDESVNFSLEELNLQPLDLIFVFPEELSNEESDLTNRIHYIIKANHDLPYHTNIQIDFANYLDEDSNLPSGDIKTFEEILPLIQYLQRVVTGYRYLKPSDYVIPEESIEPDDPSSNGFDSSELKSRVSAAKDNMQNVKNELDDLIDTYDNETGTETDLMIDSYEEGDIDKLRQQLLKASEFGLKGAIPFIYVNEHSKEALEHLINQANTITKTLKDRLDTANDYIAQFSEFSINTPDDEERAVDPLYQAARTLFGKPFKVIPLFKFYNQSEVANAYDNSNNILPDNRPFVVQEVVQGLSKVRQSVEDLDLANTLAGALGNEEDSYTPIQMPHEEDDFWYAWEFGEDQTINQDKLGFILQVPGNSSSFDITEWQGGLLIDEWVEQIPNQYEKSAVAYHYDEPDAQAPNSLIFGVTPKLTGNWNWSEINEMLLASFKLARKRAADPEIIKDSKLGGILNSYISPSPTPLPDDSNDDDLNDSRNSFNNNQGL